MMHEITRVILENEMDLILAHKQTMRLAELAGLSLAAQTTFATAVAEVCRCALTKDSTGSLSISVSDKRERIKNITADLHSDRKGWTVECEEGYKYAKRLVHNITSANTENGTHISVGYRLPQTIRIDDIVIEKWRINLNTDPALSPYEEIKRKNRQLQEMAERLRESEQQYKSLTDSLPIMIFTVNSDCFITFANQWVSDFTGYTISQINESQWTAIIHPDDMKGPCMEVRKKIKAGEHYIATELRFREPRTNTYRHHTGIFIAVFDADGSILHWNTFMVDIEARRQVEQALKDNKELKEAQDRLEEKVKELNESNLQLAQFAYIASHDLQEPLRKISFYSDMLSKRYAADIPADALPFFSGLISATERMKNLIHDVLTYSTVERALFQPVDLEEVMKNTLHDLDITLKEKNAQVEWSPLPVIDGIPVQLKQIFDNLVSNALKFADAGRTPHIQITNTVEDGILTINFKDNGIGFDKKYMHKMFDLFQKLHSGEKYKGTGIGLAICRKIIDIHGGTITAEGNPGKGAIFIISLPVRQHKG
jgi:PAS domain S-box-containing protein